MRRNLKMANNLNFINKIKHGQFMITDGRNKHENTDYNENQENFGIVV
jgi:hypothetical protein